MQSYTRTDIPAFFSIQSIVTLYYLDMQGRHPQGEAHNFWEFLYVDKGVYRLSLDGSDYNIMEGQLIFYPPNSFHCGFPSDARVGIASFECFSEQMNFFQHKIFTLNAAQKELLTRIITNGTKIFKVIPKDPACMGILPLENVPSYELQALKNLLELFLIELQKPALGNGLKPSAKNRENYKLWQINNIIVFLQNHIGETLSLEQMAAQAGVSVSCLKKLFQEYFHCGPLAYFLLMKVEEAKRMMSETTMNFTQIADALGFGSIHYFSKFFKEKTGLTPSQYAKSVYKG